MGRGKSQVIPDQGRKLLYLIETHTDRRPRSRKADGLAAGPDEGGRPSDHLSPMVTNPATLAAVLGYLDASSVSRWCRPVDADPIPARQLARICRIFMIEVADFRTTVYDHFVAICEGRAASTVSSAQAAPSAGWRRLVASATGDLAVLTADPLSGAVQVPGRRGMGYALSGGDDPDRDLPEVVQGAPFWIRLTSPGRGPRRVWAGWHLLLFNHDLDSDGFRMLVPRETSEATDWTTVYPKAARLDLPHRPVLRHPLSDHGRFAILALLTEEIAPRACVGALSRERAHGATIEATLDALAVWIEPRVALGRASVAGARYRVVMRRGWAACGHLSRGGFMCHTCAMEDFATDGSGWHGSGEVPVNAW